LRTLIIQYGRSLIAGPVTAQASLVPIVWTDQPCNCITVSSFSNIDFWWLHLCQHTLHAMFVVTAVLLTVLLVCEALVPHRGLAISATRLCRNVACSSRALSGTPFQFGVVGSTAAGDTTGKHTPRRVYRRKQCSTSEDNGDTFDAVPGACSLVSKPDDFSRLFAELEYDYLSSNSILTVTHTAKLKALGLNAKERGCSTDTLPTENSIVDKFLTTWLAAARKWGLLTGELAAAAFPPVPADIRRSSSGTVSAGSTTGSSNSEHNSYSFNVPLHKLREICDTHQASVICIGEQSVGNVYRLCIWSR
jgi:hypothetical protein